MKNRHSYLLFFCFSLLSLASFGQKGAKVWGKIVDEKQQALATVNVSVEGYSGGTSTNEKGEYQLHVPANQQITVVVSHISFLTVKKTLVLTPNESYQWDVVLQATSQNIPEFVIEGVITPPTPINMTRIDPKGIYAIPTAGGHFESVLTSQPGVATKSELSAQYSVRGGNFDENLIYVNDIEVYRPFLIRSGQQEGLSFINSDLIESILFSAGGFEARYGDKMSSVLDITYRKPKEFAGSVSASLLGGSIHLEDASKNYRFTQLHGFRYKTNQYVLNSMETKGSYRPVFLDYQTYLTYDLTDDLELAFLGNIASNKYRFVPETRATEFGTVNQALRFTVYFDGQEIDAFDTYFGALSTHYHPTHYTSYKFTASAFKTFETESFDIMGQYWLDELERDLSKDNFGDVAFNRGVGTYLNHARNNLEATVFNLQHKGSIKKNKNEVLWGAKYQNESINDQLSEWNMIDSAGYSLPHPSDSLGYTNPSLQLRQEIVLPDLLKTDITIFSNRLMGYLQHNYSWNNEDSAVISVESGIRAHYWDFNKELLISPRIAISYRPNWKKDYKFKYAWGVYHQPPFYRELRDFDGNINRNIKAQTSIHYVLGSEHHFKAWNRPFKLVTELYFKQLFHLIPYEIDNVRIRYYATNNAKGYATGIDLKINGEFVKGIDSWASLSIMETKEDIIDDYYYDYFNKKGEKIVVGYTADQEAVDSIRHEPGYIPRPTNQRVNVGLFFQDYFPRNPTYKMHLNLLFGSGFPFGPPSFERYKDTLRLPPYRRVDIGFSKQLLSEDKELPSKNPFRHFKSIWLSAEVFNLLQINNTISYLWIKDVTNRQYAIPNYLTSRRLNVKLIFRF